MTNFNDSQLKDMNEFVSLYIQAENAASGSIYDANANVTTKNIITLLGEMTKPLQLQYNRYIRSKQLEKDFDKQTADDYLNDINNHTIYIHDETHALVPYCASISLFPFLQYGSKCIGGNTDKPKHLSSFCGGLINLVNQLAAQIAGAIAMPSMLVCFDYFCRKDYGEDYLATNLKEIKQELQHLVYYLNEPCSGRNGQSVFWNLSIFDKVYLESLYGDFVYPDDGSRVDLKSVSRLQDFFLSWFNAEREKSLLTFPVVTCAMTYDEDNNIRDELFKRNICKELSKGNSFFIYTSKNVDSLASCCRLLNQSKNTFSYTLGNVGEMTGSVHVISMNLNRIIQDAFKKVDEAQSSKTIIKKALISQLERVYKYHVSTRNIFKDMKKSGMYPLYDANFLQMERQFSTIGLIGIVEAAEFMGIEINNNKDYDDFRITILKTLADSNRQAKEKYGIMFNTEFVPGENAGYKLAQWDKNAGYKVARDIYNSYFYKVEDEDLTLAEKAKLHGSGVTQYLDGGSALHYNLESQLTAEQYEKWLDMNVEVGVNYFCTNVMVTCCENESCGFINKNTEFKCIKCGSKDISHATRIIGFLKKIKNFSVARQKEAGLRYYHR
jgi:ribonucleoside-triphosphate reductase (formate)